MGKSLDKAVGLLQAIANQPRTLSELAVRAGLPASTTHRLLADLGEHGLVRQDGRTFLLGTRLMSLGERARRQFDLPDLAMPHMKALSEATQETVHLGILDGHDVVYLAKIEGSRGLQMASYVGLRSSAQTTAMGKVLIADLPRDEWESKIVDLPPRTERSIVAQADYVRELHAVAEQGYALDREENEVGVRCVAAPIRDASGRAIAAISLSGAAAYISKERQIELAPAVRACAHAVSAKLGAESSFEQGLSPSRGQTLEP